MSIVGTEIPKIGEPWYPAFVAGTSGIESYGAEVIRIHQREWLILCFHGPEEAYEWRVVAVIPDGQLRHILRYALGSVL